MIITHNLPAMNTKRRVGTSLKKRNKSLEKLASGYAINRAGDNAAGLAISEQMRHMIRGLEQGTSNAKEGIGYVNVADSALTEVHDMLQRINKLSAQSANGVYSEEARADMNEEIQELKQEISRIFDETSYNERKIWRGKEVSKHFIIWQSQPDIIKQAATYTMGSQGLDPSNLNYEILPCQNAGWSDYGATEPWGDGFQIHADENGISLSWNAFNGKHYQTDYVDWDTLKTKSYSFQMGDYLGNDPDLYGPDGKPLIDFEVSFQVEPEATLEQIIKALDDTEMRTCFYTRAEPAFEDGKNTYDGVSIAGGMIFYAAAYASKHNASSGQTGFDFASGSDKFMEPDDLSGNASSHPATGAADVEAAKKETGQHVFGFNMEGIGHVTATQVETRGYANDPFSEAEHIWWDTEYDSYGRPRKVSHYHSYQNSLSGIMDSLSGTGGTLDKANGGSLEHGGYLYMTLGLQADQAYTYGDGRTSTEVGIINIKVKVEETDTEETILKRIQDALNGDTVIDFQSDSDPAAGTVYTTREHQSLIRVPQPDIKVDEYDKWMQEVPIQCSGESDDSLKINYDSLTLDKLGLTGTNVLTQKDSAKAMEDAKAAIEYISEQRGIFGGYQNRLDHIQASNMVSDENIQAAESRIRDTDMAQELMNYTKHNILLEAGQAMLTQANVAGDKVLMLLQ